MNSNSNDHGFWKQLLESMKCETKRPHREDTKWEEMKQNLPWGLFKKNPAICNLLNEMCDLDKNFDVDDIIERQNNLFGVDSNSDGRAQKLREFDRSFYKLLKRQKEMMRQMLWTRHKTKQLTFSQQFEFHANNGLPYQPQISDQSATYIIKHANIIEGDNRYDRQSIKKYYYCYNCFKSHLTCATNQTNKNTIYRCSVCENAWYCSKKCQQNNWKYHKVSCSKPFSIDKTQITAKAFYNAVNQLKHYFQNMIIDKQLIKLIKYVEIGYEMWHNHEIDSDDGTMDDIDIPLYGSHDFFGDIGLNIHNSVLMYGLTKPQYLDYYRKFWCMPGIVEYMLHRLYISKGLINLRSKHKIDYFQAINDISSHIKLEQSIWFGNSCTINEWSWWICHIFSVTCTHDALLNRENRPMSVQNEGITMLQDENVMPMRNAVLSKIVEIFINIDCLESLDESFMSIGCNIIGRLMLNNKMKMYLIRNNVFKSIMFVARRCSNQMGVIQMIKRIRYPNDLELMSDTDKLQLVIAIFNFFKFARERVSIDEQFGSVELRQVQIKYFDSILVLLLLNLFGKNNIHITHIQYGRGNIRMVKCIRKYFETFLNSKQFGACSLANEMFLLTPYHKQVCYYGIKYFDNIISYQMIDRTLRDEKNLMHGIYQSIDSNIVHLQSEKDKICDKFKTIIKEKRQKEKEKNTEQKKHNKSDSKDVKEITVPMCSWMLCSNYKNKKCQGGVLRTSKNSKFRTFYRCSRCKKTKYCSKLCQKKDWKIGHRSKCFELIKKAHDSCY